MKSSRCEEIILQLIVRTYDDTGCPVREQVSQPRKLFRNAETQDVWAEVDKVVQTMQAGPLSAPGRTTRPTVP